jgi:hypothetical protein
MLPPGLGAPGSDVVEFKKQAFLALNSDRDRLAQAALPGKENERMSAQLTPI